MLISFGDQGTEDIFNGVSSKKALKISKDFWGVARRKLDMLNAAFNLHDLKVPPGNRLERLSGQYKNYHSIRINDQFRIIFQWTGNSASDVQIIDYH